MDKLLTVAEVAARLGVSKTTIYRMIYRGELRASKVGPRLWRISEADLEAAARTAVVVVFKRSIRGG